MARLKKVFNGYDQVAHLWAHAQQNEASCRRFYFEKSTIYSYGSHFPIAQIYYKKKAYPLYAENGERTGAQPEIDYVMFTTDGYSRTTGVHIGAAKSALPNWWKVFYVPEVEAGKYPTKHETNIKYFIREIETAASKLLNAKRDSTRESYGSYLRRSLAAAKDYVEFFGKDAKKFLTKKQATMIMNSIAEPAEVQASALDAAKKAADKQKKANADRVKKAIIAVADWREGTSGSMYGIHYEKDLAGIQGIILRVVSFEGEEKYIQTSNSMKVEYKEAKRLFGLVCKCRKAKTGYKQDDQKETTKAYRAKTDNSEYHVKEISSEGDILIGCTLILWPEIELIARKEAWVC